MKKPPTITDFFNVTNPVEHPLRQDLINMVYDRYHATPRHLQIELGPSEVGHPCMRNLAYGLLNVPECNPEFDPLPSIVGTASHTWMDSAAALANQRLKRERWLHEQRVHPSASLHGSADLFDTDTGTVIDYKFPGANRFDMYVKNMSIIFKRQGHLYGLGFENAGYAVNEVVVALFPRGGYLKNLHMWSEPYDRQIALDALENLDKVIQLCNDLEVDEHPERFKWITATPYDCRFCSYFSPDPHSGYECDGKS